MDENDRRFIEMLFTKQTEQFQQYLGVITENFDHKLGLIAEGHQMLAEKLDRIEARIGAAESNFSKKIDGMAADLAAHWADTEAHHGMYRVKEGGWEG